MRDRCPSSVLAALLLSLTFVHAGAAEEEEATAAVLKRHDLSFNYRSTVTPLSCFELQNRVAAIFRALGARDDVDVRATHCENVIVPDMPGDDWMREPGTWRSRSDPWSASDPWESGAQRERDRFNRGQSSLVRVSLLMPVEVTPEVLEEMKKDKTRRELISRVTGDPQAKMDEPIVFAARRQEVTLSRRTIDLEPKDCELLEQMSKSVFRKLGIRVVGSAPSCGRDRTSHISPNLTVEALMPVLPSVPQLSPPSGESEPEESG